MRPICQLMLIVTVAVLALCVLSSPALAQMREFTGQVESASAAKLVVDNSGGDKLAFAPAAGVVVSGGRQSWAALAKGDWVTISWKIGDTPRKAHRVVVLPPRSE